MFSNALKNFVTGKLNDQLNQIVDVLATKQVYGGDINDTFILHTTSGDFFVKLNNIGFADMFEKEFSALQLLNSTNTLIVPKPITYGVHQESRFLIMEAIEKGVPGERFWQHFATKLAQLHKSANDKFGLDVDNYIGSLPQQNSYSVSWNEFYANQRVVPLMKKAYEQNKCSFNDLKLAEQLCKKFDRLFPQEPPSLLHGDLWSGNFMGNENGDPVIFDPAVYYGNREMDIAMTLLFGGFDKSFYDYYNEAYRLQQDWKNRVKLCQLYPLLVHLILFGGNYYNSIMNVIKFYK